MKAKRSWMRKRRAALPLSAMIDVIFLLLIFFVVTYRPSLLEAQAAVNLPSAGRPSVRLPLELRILPDRYVYMGRPMTLHWIEEQLQRAAVLEPDATILIKISPQAQQGQLIAVLDLCNKLGLKNLNVLTLRETTVQE